MPHSLSPRSRLLLGLVALFAGLAPVATAADPIVLESATPVFTSPKEDSFKWVLPRRAFGVRWAAPTLAEADRSLFGDPASAVSRVELALLAAMPDEEGCEGCPTPRSALSALDRRRAGSR